MKDLLKLSVLPETGVEPPDDDTDELGKLSGKPDKLIERIIGGAM